MSGIPPPTRMTMHRFTRAQYLYNRSNSWWTCVHMKILLHKKSLKRTHLGYSECTPTSAMPASSLPATAAESRFPPAHGVFIEPGIDNVDTGFRSCRVVAIRWKSVPNFQTKRVPQRNPSSSRYSVRCGWWCSLGVGGEKEYHC